MTKLEQFQTAEWSQQMKLLRDPETAAAVRGWIGDGAFAELETYAGVVHLGAGATNMIVVPGVMGSILQSAGLGGVWWLDLVRARKQLNQLALASDGVSDINPGYKVEPCAIDLNYGPFREAILASSAFGGSEQFPYDWRKPLAASAAGLSAKIQQVYQDYGQAVHLVGHSMGGLLIRTTLMQYGADLWPKIGKIAFLATPHYGSPSIAGYVMNHLWGWEELAVLAAFLSRETFRSLWGVLSLLPAPAGIYPGTRRGEDHPCANFDMYKADAWRLSMSSAESMQLQNALDAAAKFHRDLYDWHTTQLAPANRKKMLQITGVGYKTLFRLEVKNGWLGLWKDVDKITRRVPGDLNRDGDGRVPLASAGLEDVEQRFVKGSHGNIQNVPSVAREVLAWIADDPLTLPDTPQGALGTHLAGSDVSPTPHLDASDGIGTVDDEYDRYHEVDPARVEQMIAEVEAGRLPDINLVRIL